MLKLNSLSNKSDNSKIILESSNSDSVVDSKVQHVAAPAIEGMVSNLRDLNFQVITHVPGVSKTLSSDLVIKSCMNLTPFPSVNLNSQKTDPKEFFLQLGIDIPPINCSKSILQDFYKLVSASLLTNFITIKDFMDLDVYSHIKSIHEKNFSPALTSKMEEMMHKWCEIYMRSSNELATKSELFEYFKDVNLFHQQMKESLKTETKHGQKKIDYLFPSILSKLNQNYQFLMLFSNKEYHSLLSFTGLKQLSGTYFMIPKDASQIKKILMNLQNYGEFQIKSQLTEKDKTHHNFLTQTLFRLKALTSSPVSQSSLNEFKNFRSECYKNIMTLVDKIYCCFGLYELRYTNGAGGTDRNFLGKQITLLKNMQKISEVTDMLTVSQIISDISVIVDRSILPILSTEYIKDELFIRRFELVLRSILEELPNLNMPKRESTGFGKYLENLRDDFFQKLLRSHFYDRARDYAESNVSESQPILAQFAIKKLYQIIKPLTEQMIESLKEECSKLSISEFQTFSLFSKTDWLAKTLLLSHDIGTILMDPSVNQDFDFHPEYLKLINQYDPTVTIPIIETVDELEDLEPPLSIHLNAPLENKQETKKELLVPNLSKKALKSPVNSLSKVLETLNKHESPLQRSVLRNDISKTDGDLRKLGKVLLANLGWKIEGGKKHPVIIDAQGRKIAPVPNSGHAGLGTVLSIANRVCDAAQEQGLLSS